MQFKKGDLVKLVSWKHWLANDDAGKTPLIWGGPSGYKMGTVVKTFTGDHDSSRHHLAVSFSNGDTVDLVEGQLESVDVDDKQIAINSTMLSGPVSRDIWILVRTTQGNWGLNVIEVLPFGSADINARYVSGISRFKLPNIDQNDFNLVSHMLAQQDYEEKRSSELFTAANQVFLAWDLPPLDAVDLPLPRFTSIREAAASCPADAKTAVLFFHTPHILSEYSDTLLSAVS